MCSCSGSCNCNSTTIPRGPQGIQGNTGPAGPASTVPGPPGEDGIDGINGLNAFTTLTDDFVQPAVNANVTIHVVDATWVAVNSIIFIESSSTTDAGGYYQVVFASNLPTPTIVIKNLGWTIPSTVFVSPGSAVGEIGTLVVAAGTIGATGPQGPTGTTIIDAKWGAFLGSGGANDFKTSILVPANTLTTEDDVLECQTVFRIQGPIISGVRYFKIKISTVDNDGTVGTVAYQNNIDIPLIALSNTYATVHMNYKIQYVNSTSTRSKGEAFLSVADVYTGSSITDLEIDKTYLCTTLFAGFNINWSNDQFITVVVEDEVTPAVTVVHHEVKFIKK